MQKMTLFLIEEEKISEALSLFPLVFHKNLEIVVDKSLEILRGKFSKSVSRCSLFYHDKLYMIGPDSSSIFFDEEATYKDIALGFGKDPLLKSFGKISANEQIIDVTAGTLKDSLHLVKLGFKVVAFERNPVIFAYLKSGLKKYQPSIELIYGDYSKSNSAYSFSPQYLYYDPMFEGTLEKSAKPRKEMIIFHELINFFSSFDEFHETKSDQDTFQHLFHLCHNKLVVKRSPKASEFKTPTYKIESKSVRFDVYDLSFKNKG